MSEPEQPPQSDSPTTKREPEASAEVMAIVPPPGEVREYPTDESTRALIDEAVERGIVVVLRGGPGRHVYRRASGTEPTREPSATGGIDPDPPDPGAVGKGWAPHTFLTMGLILAVDFCHADPLLLVTSALLLASAWAAWLLARRDPRHRPVRDGLLVAAACMLVREALHVTVLHGGPYAGWARAAFHLEEATRLVTAAVPAWMAWATLRRFPPGPNAWRCIGIAVAAGAWCSLLAHLVAAYPDVRQMPLDAREQWLKLRYLGAELASLFVALLAVASWARRSRSLAREREAIAARLAKGWDDIAANSGLENDAERASLPRWYTTAPVLMLVGGDLALLLVGAWRWGLFGSAYVVQQWGLLALYGAIVVAQAVALRRGRA